jgi:hypothetical protein
MLSIVKLSRATATTWQHAAAVHAHPAVRIAAAAAGHHALAHVVAAHRARCMPQHLPASTGDCRVRDRPPGSSDSLQQANDTNTGRTSRCTWMMQVHTHRGQHAAAA